MKRPYVPKPKEPAHPHSPPRERRGRAEEAARLTMFTGIEVHQVATRMGLVEKAREAEHSAYVSTLPGASAAMGADGASPPASKAPLSADEKKALAVDALFSAVRELRPSVYNPLVDGKRSERWGPAPVPAGPAAPSAAA